MPTVTHLTDKDPVILTTGSQGLYSDYYPYLASWFTTNSPSVPTGLHIATSKNGLDWNVITSRPNSFTNELRDPSIVQLNNKWAIAYTENAFASDPFNTASNNSGFFGLLESTNLSEWSYKRVSLSGLLNNIGIPPTNYNRLWAPEWFKEDDGTLYLTFSINQTGWGNHNRGHMTYIVQATNYNLTGWTNLRRVSGTAFPFLPSVGVTESYYDLFIEKTGNIYYGVYWDEQNIETRLATSNNLFTGWNVIASGKSWYGNNFPTYTSFTDGSYKEGGCIRYLDGKWRLWVTDVLGVNSGIYSEGLTPTGMSFVGLTSSPNYRLEHGTVIKNNNVANMIYYSGLVNQYSNQIISGIKNFSIRPTVNGTGVLLTGEAILPFVNINNITTNFSFNNSYNSKLLTINASQNITGTVPTGLPTGYNVSFAQMNSGKLFITGSGGAIVRQRLNLYNTAGQYAVASLVNYSGNQYLLYGDLN